MDDFRGELFVREFWERKRDDDSVEKLVGPTGSKDVHLPCGILFLHPSPP